MALTLYYHPLSSFCHKALVALYENATPFRPQVVNLQDPQERAQFLQVWPIGKFPVLRDEARAVTVPESSIIIEYLNQHHAGPSVLLPKDPDKARQVRLQDRFFDLYMHLPMQKVIGDRLRPADGHDPTGVAEARSQLKSAYAILEKDLAGHTWAVGEEFSMADCAALPALFYGKMVHPFEAFGTVVRYYDRLLARPSVARVLEEARPYFKMIPQEPQTRS